jgi:nitrate/TMAO reductase-like tetraheme cytochrome c subunit
MQRLSFLILLLIGSLGTFGQSPHEKDLRFDCKECHSTTGWKVNPAQLAFSHDSTTFKLIGQHQYTNCRSCHTTLTFSGTHKECISCHKDMHSNTVGPDCAKCHTPETWIIENVTQMHLESRFPLSGAHANADCASCHPNVATLKFEPLGVECVSCHRKDFLDAKNPDHQAAGYSTNCSDCHRASAYGWKGGDFEHVGFPLTGSHNISCDKCHTDGTFVKLPTDCFSCHQEDFLATKIPNHTQLDFSHQCDECHSTGAGWEDAKVNDHDQRFFPIYSGTHGGVWNKCNECHTNQDNYAQFSCTDCHQHSNKASVDRDHREEPGYEYNSIACYGCHPKGNDKGTFNHSETRFPLTGQHMTAGCEDCHTAGFAGTSILCKDCHEDDYTTAKEPIHSNAGITLDCESCHTSDGWKPSTFNHTGTGFELKGAHTGITQCADCHKGTITSATSDCFSCHEEQFNQAKDHLSKSYPHLCDMCHNNDNWLNPIFDHSKTSFPLTGAHIQTECTKCHTNGYAGTPSDCNSCHNTLYQQAKTPNHVNAGMPVQCETCHNTTAFVPSTFNHATTGFQLQGAHTGIVQCSDCHKGNLVSAATDCFSCHEAQYNGAPSHAAQKYPHDCTICHNNNNWLNAVFDHNKTAFPLTGSHIGTDCSKCHANGFSGTPTDCNSCHHSSYTGATVPNHINAGIPLTCQTCHNTVSWEPSSFNHNSTGFILLGAHTSIEQCSSCHKGNLTTAKTDCYSCHTTQFNNAPGHVSQGFPHECGQCHNNNTWANATFDHSKTSFPLTGAHTTATCKSCHANGYSGTPKECLSCHQADYNGTTDPNHKTLVFPTDCEFCHNTSNWSSTTYNHDTQYFPIYSGAHRGEWTLCTDCHKVPGNYGNFTCIDCHEHNRTSMDSEHRNVANYSYTSTACYSCHPKGKGIL